MTSTQSLTLMAQLISFTGVVRRCRCDFANGREFLGKEGAIMSQAIQVTESTILPIQSMPGESREQTALRIASERFSKATDWVTFFREILGVDGIIRRTFSNPDELEAFERRDEYIQIQQMLAKLRERKEAQNEEGEPTRVITVRLPKSLHESLRHEAHSRQTSMNKLCISKLLQMIDNELVPSD
jgi:predicted HicB family RNase H-like nuclease